MRTLLFTLFLMSLLNLDAQEIYLSGKIAKGKTAAYYCERDNYFITARNVNNTDTLQTLYYMDGTVVPDFECENLDATIGYNQADLHRVLREALTDEEWEKIKGKTGQGLLFHITADSTGHTKELTFTFRINDPVFAKFPPDRLYQLELKFKEAIKLIYRPTSKRFRNAKYSVPLLYKELE